MKALKSYKVNAAVARGVQSANEKFVPVLNKLLEVTNNGEKELKAVVDCDCLICFFDADGVTLIQPKDFGFKFLMLSAFLTKVVIE